MTKTEFITSLEHKLRQIPKTERDSFLEYYEELIQDFIENGVPEADAVIRVGVPSEIAEEILSENRHLTIKVPSTGSKILNYILLLLGFPIWGTLLAIVAGAIFFVYLLVWAIPFAIGGIGVLAIWFLINLVPELFWIFTNNIAAGIALTGTCLGAAGIVLLCGFLVVFVSKYMIQATAYVTRKIKGVFAKKGVALS